MKKLLLTGGILLACMTSSYAQHRTGLKIDSGSTSNIMVNYDVNTEQYTSLSKIVHDKGVYTVPIQTTIGGNEEAIIKYDVADKKIQAECYSDYVRYATFYISQWQGGAIMISMSQPSKLSQQEGRSVMKKIFTNIN